MIWFRRIILLIVFALFWGGLTFYTGFVVRAVHDVLDDPMDGGLITQRVTGILQWLGVVCWVMMSIDAFSVWRHQKKRGTVLIVCCAVFGLSLVGLFLIHGQLNSLTNVQERFVVDDLKFESWHRLYKQVTIIEWFACLAYLPVTVIAWSSPGSAN